MVQCHDSDQPEVSANKPGQEVGGYVFYDKGSDPNECMRKMIEFAEASLEEHQPYEIRVGWAKTSDSSLVGWSWHSENRFMSDIKWAVFNTEDIAPYQKEIEAVLNAGLWYIVGRYIA
jgi:hypothetical protein